MLGLESNEVNSISSDHFINLESTTKPLPIDLASMRPTARVFARYLEAGTPTGLTGLWTHATPRSTLLYLYGTTLSKLQNIPETSMYRQSVEAVTKHRMSLVEQLVPPGYEEWAVRAKELVSKNSSQFRVASGRVDGSEARTVKIGDKVFVVGRKHEEGDIRLEEWNGEVNEGPEYEGIRTAAEREDQVVWAERKPLENHEQVEWEDEPQLTADQCVSPRLGYSSIGRYRVGLINSRGIGSRSSSTRLALASSRRSSRLPRASSS